MSDSIALRRAALGPLLHPPSVEPAVAAARRDADALDGYLIQHRLALLWAAALRERECWPEVPAAFRERLAQRQLGATAVALAQEHAARDLTAALTAAELEHAFMKGIHLRRELYAHPALRPADDVDVLVAAGDRDLALATLSAAGFARVDKPGPATHEASLKRGSVSIDLHWHPFRPGRARSDPAPAMLARRVQRDGLPVLDELSTSLLLAVGGALGDYVTGRLLRAVELDRWVRGGRLPDADFVDLVRSLGLATAAWVMLEWTRQCLGTPFAATTLQALAPGPARRRYLTTWLALDPAKIYRRSPTLARLGFTLALEDTPRDALRSLSRRARAGIARP